MTKRGEQTPAHSPGVGQAHEWISEVGVSLFPSAPDERGGDCDEWTAVVVDDDEPERAPSVAADVVAYATVGGCSVTTGYAERLGVALRVGASRKQVKADVRSYLMGSGFWACYAPIFTRKPASPFPTNSSTESWGRCIARQH
jgi:hypothetical protein